MREMKELEELKEKLVNALNDKEFFGRIMNMEKVEDVQKAFAEREINLTKEEVQVLGAIINKECEKKGKALSQEELNEVVGGKGGVAENFFEGLLGHNPIGPIIYKIEDSSKTSDKQFDSNAEFVAAEAGALVGTAALAAASIGAYKGVKWAYNKIKGKDKDKDN